MRPKKKTLVTSSTGAEKEYAEDLVRKGLLPKGTDMNRAMRALSAIETDDHDAGKSNSRPGSRGAGLPKNWAEAKRLAAEKEKQKPVRIPSANRTTRESSAVVVPSKPRKSLYGTPKKNSKSKQAAKGNNNVPEIEEFTQAKNKKSETIKANGEMKESNTATKPLRSHNGPRPKLQHLSNRARLAAEARGNEQGKLICELLTDKDVDVAYVRYALHCAAGLVSEPGHADVSHIAANWASRDSAVLMDGPSITQGQPGVSLLHQCARRDLSDAAAALIEHGAEVNRVNRWDESPLHWAASSNAYHTAALLLDFGADVTLQDASGSCPLMRAAHGGHLEIVSLLLSRARGSISANKLKIALQIARDAIEGETEHDIDADEKAAKGAALVLIQRHLKLLKAEDKQQTLAQAAVSSPVKDIAVSSQLVTQLQEAMDAQVVALTYSQPPSHQSLVEESLFSLDVDTESAMEAEISRLAAQCDELRDVPGSAEAGASAFPLAPPPEKPKPVIIVPQHSEKRGRKAPGKVVAGVKEKGKQVAKEEPALPLSAVVPAKKTGGKYAPAAYVPFLHSALALGGSALGTACEVGDVLLTVEQCFNCETHNFSLWHDPMKYSSVADRCLIALVRALLDKGYRVRLFALKEVPRAARTGALEISCSVCVGSGDSTVGQWVTHTLHSKLESSTWPSVKRVAAKGTSFVHWVLDSKNLTNHLPVGEIAASKGLPLQLALLNSNERTNTQQILEAEVGMPGSAMKKLQVEGQFMSWLIRLSMSSATSTSPVPTKKSKGKGKGNSSAHDAVAAILGIGMQNLEEWTRTNITSFGPFFNIQSRIGTASSVAATAAAPVAAGAPSSAQKGKRGQELAEASTPFGAALPLEAFEQLVLSHFFVFDNIKSAKPEIGSEPAPVTSENVKEGITDSKETPTNGKPKRLSSPSPERSVAEGFMEQTQKQATKQAEKAISSQRRGPPRVHFEMDIPVHAPSSHAVRLAVDDRVEGNYRGSGAWYKGVITGSHQDPEGHVTYDVLYDDDEEENDKPANDVRAVIRKSLAARMMLSTSPESDATVVKSASAAVESDDDLEGSIQYENTASPVRSEVISKLSPATPTSLGNSVDSLALSLSASTGL